MRLETQERKHQPVWLFFALTFLLSWVCWIALAISGRDPMRSAWIIAYLLGGLGPSIVGVGMMIHTTPKRDDRRDFWKRLVNFRAISAGWYLVIVLIFPLVFAVTYLVDGWLGGADATFPTLEMIAANPLLLVGLLFSSFIVGAISEELGWRGFALDKLQARWNPSVSSLILSFFWWAWHLPLFFVKGTTQHAIGIGTTGFLVFTLCIIPLTFIMTWAYNHNQRSILSAVLLHMAYTFFLSLFFPLPHTQVIFLFLAAALVVLVTEFRGTKSVEV